MPTYVYECKTCNRVFEADQSIKDDPLDTCECGAVGTVKRVIQPVAISFKGSGFYVNDSQKSAAPAEKPAEAGEPAAEKPASDKPAEAATPAVESAAPVSAPASTAEPKTG